MAYASARGDPVGMFALMLAATGCRLSEALELTAGQVDFSEEVIVLRSLKKRRSDVYRTVPVSTTFLGELRRIHFGKAVPSETRLWPWSRTTGWGHVKAILADAGITGIHATPKGLRHGFCAAALLDGVPLSVVQKWLGHASIETTAIYSQVVGPEERRLATRLWHSEGTAELHRCRYPDCPHKHSHWR